MEIIAYGIVAFVGSFVATVAIMSVAAIVHTRKY